MRKDLYQFRPFSISTLAFEFIEIQSKDCYAGFQSTVSGLVGSHCRLVNCRLCKFHRCVKLLQCPCLTSEAHLAGAKLQEIQSYLY